VNLRRAASPSVRVNGPALRHVREGSGLSLGHLGRAAGVSTSFLSAVERGARRGMRTKVFLVLLAELGLTDARVLLADPYGVDVAELAAHPCEPMAQNGLHSRSKTRAA
jgi:transcriptional regulator with XRE-family HTH domain